MSVGLKPTQAVTLIEWKATFGDDNAFQLVPTAHHEIRTGPMS